MLIASGADQAYRAADGAADFDRQAVLAKTLSVEMDGIRTVRFLVQNHGTTPLPAGTLQVEACPSKAYTQGMASLRPLPAGEADVVTVTVKPTDRFGFSDVPSAMRVTVRRDGEAPQSFAFKELVSEHANEMRMKHLATPFVRVLLLGASDSGKSAMRNTAHTALARRGRSGVSSVAPVGGNSKAGAGALGSEKQSHTVAVEYTLVDRVVMMDGPGQIVTRPAVVSLLMDGSAVPGMTMADLDRVAASEKERKKLCSAACGGPGRVPQSVIFCMRADEVDADSATQERARQAYDAVRDHRALVAVTFSDLANIVPEQLQVHGNAAVADLAKRAAGVLGVDAQVVHVVINYTKETEPAHGMDVAVLRLLRASVAQADEWEQQRLRREDADLDTIDSLLDA